ncbi:uncharacterized protein BO87DRAFT_101838 [Aspergillus neoniger CBS 115656]|uniref:Secreted protein n=1 Tax=Aspergillus neoniger (strain CBS 115656) TaxID=1448310 RepID=A0A318YFS0_ASPNB|nr:hypothetical protein BO87DRAFT_101838 [Aspergillus neoniger CBS 115656]PYH32497.1 hypothetical protein BO87DRAFT_101838 [Aspergillus neoniger CBS 115656]
MHWVLRFGLCCLGFTQRAIPVNELILYSPPSELSSPSSPSPPTRVIIATNHCPSMAYKPSFRPRGYPARAKPCWVLIRTKRTKQFPDADQYLRRCLDSWPQAPCLLRAFWGRGEATRTIHQSLSSSLQLEESTFPV